MENQQPLAEQLFEGPSIYRGRSVLRSLPWLVGTRLPCGRWSKHSFWKMIG